MPLSIKEYLIDFLSGAYVGLVAIILAVTTVILFNIFKIRVLRVGAKLMPVKAIVIEAGLLNGVDLNPYKEKYSATELVEIMEVLIRGGDGEYILNNILTVQEIREMRVKNRSIIQETVASLPEYREEGEDDEDADEDDDLPSIYNLGHLGIDTDIMNVEDLMLEYEVRGSVAYFQTFTSPVPYQMLRAQEGTVFYRVGSATLYLEGKWLL